MRKYTLLDGYTPANGYVIKQDRKGYLWIGTDNGALRFDGNRFEVLRERFVPAADQEIISCNPYGKDQVLLVPLLNNIACYKEGEVLSGRKDPRLARISNTGQNNVFTDIFTGSIWLSDETRLKTLYCFSAKDIKKVDVADDGFFIIAVRNNRIICRNHTDSLLRQYDLSERRYKPLYDSRMKPFSYKGTVETKEDGSYIFVYNTDRPNIAVYAFRNDSTLYLVKTACWPSTEKSVVLTDEALNLWFKFLDGGMAYSGNENRGPVPRPFYFMDKTVVNYLFVDRQQNIWLSGQNNSLYFLSRKHFQNALRVQEVLPCAGIPKFINGDSDGNIAIGYVNRSVFSIRKNGKVKHYRLNQHFYEGVRCICPLGNSRFLIMDKDLALVDGLKNSVQYFNGLSTYKDIALYKDGGLLVACQNNAFYLDYDIKSGSTANIPQVVFKGRVSSIAALADSTVLVGTPDGLFIKKGLWAKAFKISHPELSNSNITDIADKGNSSALISTNGQGVYYFNAAKGTATPVPLFHEMNTITVRRIFKQHDSLYWFATEKGAYEVQFDKESKVKHIRNYTFYDGLPSNNVTSIYVYRDTAFIATTEGLGIMPLADSGLLQMSPPLVYLNSVRLQDTLLNPPGNTVELSYRQNEFMISLSGISYESFGNVSYRYKLEGLNDEWTETGNSEINFSGLSPGSYVFTAYAVNAKGAKSETPVTLNFHIRPAFWQTLLFKALVCLLAASVFYLFIRRRTNRIALRKYERAKQERKLAELELEAIKAHINPHFIYNCLNSIQYFNYEGRHDLSKQYLDLFARLIRFTIQYSRQTFISIAEETAYLSDYLQLEKMRFRERLQFSIIVADSINPQMMIPAMLIQPYVENALKHGIAAKRNGGHVVVRFDKTEENMLEILVEDDGMGFSPDYNVEKDSLGLRLSGSRAQTYNQLFGMNIEISFHNKKDLSPDKSGAIVLIKIPIPL